MNTSDLKSFYYLENGEISFSMLDTRKTAKQMDAGCYNVSWLPYPDTRVKVELNKDAETVKIHNFPDRTKLDELFSSFFDERVYNKIFSLGFYHKVGVLLYGKEGTGKSTILKYYYSKAIREHRALVFNIICKPHEMDKCWDFIMKVRSVQPNPFVILFEEFDSHLKDNNESFLKTVLDGNMSINNCIFLATTNYIEAVPSAMKNRASRFKYVLDIEGVQSKGEVVAIIEKMIGDSFSDSEIDGFAKNLQGSTLDAIKQFCVDKIMDLKTYGQKKRGGIVGFLQNQN